MNKKIPLGAAIAFMVVVAGITFCITMMVSLNHFNQKVYNVKAREVMYKKLADVDSEARQNYMGTIDEEVLSDAISSGYIRGLNDKYSYYLTKNEYEEKLLEQKGQRISIGVTIEKDQTGYMRVKEVLKASPAEEEGILPGDLLITIGDTDLKSLSLTSADRMLKGEEGTKVSIVYRRDGVDTKKEIIRKSVEMQFITHRLIGTNGYIKINEFNDKTFTQFKTAVDDLIAKGATGLVFDLRDNTTDSIESANKMLNYLCPSGDLGTIVGKKGTTETRTISGTSDPYEVDLPMTVLINAKTAGTSEYFAGTLRDFEKVSIVGVQSTGKTSIQELRPLRDGSAVNVTVAYYLTSSGANLAGGIKPEYEVKLTVEQEQNFASLTEETDPQLKKALELLNSKKEEPAA